MLRGVFLNSFALFLFGAVAQLEERVVRNDEVGSSNLLGSTIFFSINTSTCAKRIAVIRFGLTSVRLTFLSSVIFPNNKP